jgi:hypothetical protein
MAVLFVWRPVSDYKKFGSYRPNFPGSTRKVSDWCRLLASLPHRLARLSFVSVKAAT